MELLNEEQLSVINYLNNGQSVYLSGQAGTGKTFLIKHISSLYEDLVITSTTGISALPINGITLHSFLGIGLGKEPVDKLIQKIRFNKNTKERIIKCKYLVIDEVSMLNKELFEKINCILQTIRRNKLFFGGIVLLASGDFLQLEPVEESGFIFESESWIKNMNNVVLSKNYRQQDDNTFQGILNGIRYNNLTDEHTLLLKQRIIKNISECKETCIVIFGTNKKVNEYNKKQIETNINKEYTFIAEYKGNNLLKNELKKQFISKDIDKLVLKEGYKVMLTKNLDISRNLINGAIGVIVGFDYGLPLVKFNDEIVNINYETWELSSSNFNEKAKAIQLPLILAYAITIHKSQGMTVKNAIIDTNSCFCNHQVYTALSRVISLNGVYLLNFNINKIKTNQKVLDYYKNL